MPSIDPRGGVTYHARATVGYGSLTWFPIGKRRCIHAEFPDGYYLVILPGPGVDPPGQQERKQRFWLIFLGTRIWQIGALDWWGRIDDQQVCLGRRECPLPPEEGDQWQVRATGEIFRIINGEIRRIDRAPVEDFV